MAGATKGERRSTTAGAPPLAGVVERIDTGKNLHEALLRLEESAPGAAFVGAFTWGGKVHVMVSFFLYGEGAAEVAAREEAAWQGGWGSGFRRVERRARSPDGEQVAFYSSP